MAILEVANGHMRTVTARPWLNVRSEPSLAAQIVGRAETGRRVVVSDEIVGQKYKWLEIGFDGSIAYLAKKWTTAFHFDNWPCDVQIVSQHFGLRPAYYGQWDLPGHEGIDIALGHSDEVKAVADGIVYYVRVNPYGHNYGVHVRVEHIDYHKTIYAHLLETAGGIAVGETITAGTVIGYGDSTGNSSGTHLHLTLKAPYAPWDWPGDQIDPWPYLKHLQ